MNIFNDNLWSKLPIPDFRGRFFVESCFELLHIQTPPFHQSRFLNVISSTKEVLISINDYQYDEKNLRNLYNSIRELKSCLKIDSVMKTVIINYQDNLNSLFDEIKDDDQIKINDEKLRKLKLLCNNILNIEEVYIQKLTEELLYNITSLDIDLKRIGIITKSIYELTTLYITHLLSKNYSASYLYNRMQMFVRINNYKNRSFSEQVEYVFDKLNNRIDKYSVYFAIKSTHLTKLKKHAIDRNLYLLDNLNELFEKEHIKKINPNNIYNSYILIEVDATDYISASFKAKEKINSMIDMMSFHNLIHSNDVHNICLVSNKEMNFTKYVDLEFLLKHVTTTYTKKYDRHYNIIHHISKRLELKSYERIKRSFHYLRLSKDTNSLDQKLLNIWISLESLFDKYENTIIGNITQWVPKIYAISSISDRINYILELLIKYKIPIPQKIKDSYSLNKAMFFKEVSLEDFSPIFFDESAIEMIFKSIKNKEFLKYRIQSTFHELKNSKKIILRIDKTIRDVDRQIKRIYVTRNKLTHQAFHGNIKGQIVNHLYEYLMMCYHAIFLTLEKSKESRKITIDDALLSYQMGSDNLYEKLKAFNEEKDKLNFSLINVKAII